MLIKSRILIVFPARLSLELRNTMHGLYSRLHENILLSDSVHAAKRRRRRWKKKQKQKCFNCYFCVSFSVFPHIHVALREQATPRSFIVINIWSCYCCCLGVRASFSHSSSRVKKTMRNLLICLFLATFFEAIRWVKPRTFCRTPSRVMLICNFLRLRAHNSRSRGWGCGVRN